MPSPVKFVSILKRLTPRPYHAALLLGLVTGFLNQSVLAFDAIEQLSDLDGNTGFRLNGSQAEQRLVSAVSSAGDINGDGIDDIIIGAPLTDVSDGGLTDLDTGAIYVVFGRQGGFSSSQTFVSSLDGTNGFRIEGDDANYQIGAAVSFAGDINDDGIDDLLIGAPSTSPNGVSSGTAYVLFGRDTAFPAQLFLAQLADGVGFRIEGEAQFDRLGASLSAAGDINDDGVDDIIVGAPGASINGRGSAFVIFGKNTANTSNFPVPFDLDGLDGSNGFRVDASGLAGGANSFGATSLGQSVSGGEDINDDGIDDLIIGASIFSNDSTPGGGFVVYGSGSAFLAAIDSQDLDGTNGFLFHGVSDSDSAGFSVSRAGDINADGIGDFVVGARFADNNGLTNSGSSYVVYGSAGSFPSVFPLASLNGSNGFRIDGVSQNDFTGESVSAAGDVNADGVDDLILGAYGADNNGSNSGSSYVVYGRSANYGSTLRLATLNAFNGFRLDGETGLTGGENSGAAVSAAGDVNGDGIDDIIIGAPLSRPDALTGAGSAYIVFGSSEPPKDDSFCTSVKSRNGNVVSFCL